MSNISCSKRFDETEQARLRCLDVVKHDNISGELTKNFGRHNSVFGRLDRKPILPYAKSNSIAPQLTLTPLSYSSTFNGAS